MTAKTNAAFLSTMRPYKHLDLFFSQDPFQMICTVKRNEAWREIRWTLVKWGNILMGLTVPQGVNNTAGGLHLHLPWAYLLPPFSVYLLQWLQVEIRWLSNQPNIEQASITCAGIHTHTHKIAWTHKHGRQSAVFRLFPSLLLLYDNLRP